MGPGKGVRRLSTKRLVDLKVKKKFMRNEEKENDQYGQLLFCFLKKKTGTGRMNYFSVQKNFSPVAFLS